MKNLNGSEFEIGSLAEDNSGCLVVILKWVDSEKSFLTQRTRDGFILLQEPGKLKSPN